LTGSHLLHYRRGGEGPFRKPLCFQERTLTGWFIRPSLRAKNGGRGAKSGRETSIKRSARAFLELSSFGEPQDQEANLAAKRKSGTRHVGLVEGCFGLRLTQPLERKTGGVNGFTQEVMVSRGRTTWHIAGGGEAT